MTDRRQMCRRTDLPSTKLGNDATFFVGWKKETQDMPDE